MILFTVPIATGPVDTSEAAVSEPEAAFASDGTNTMSSVNLLPGDILCTGSDDTIFDYLIPGKWTHTLIFGGVTTAAGQVWDTEHGCWLGAGVAWVIHSTSGGSAMASGRPSWDDDSGLRTSSFQCAINDHAGNVAALRVLKNGGVQMTATERNAIVSFCTSRLTQSNGYDFNWLAKQIEIDTGTAPWLPPWAPDGYYCSELPWAAYMNNLGIDLDGDFSPLNVGVSPEDIYWSENAQVIALEMNSDPNGGAVPGGAYKIDASATTYKVSMRVYQIRYDSDKEGWPSGDGEMYLKCWIGEAYFPSCAETHQTGDTNWDKIDDASDDYKSGVDDGDTVTWNSYHYALVSYNSYCKIRLQTVEDDGIGADDYYPVFQWWWAPTTWHGYIDTGWHSNGGLVDYGDCRYYVLFNIESC